MASLFSGMLVHGNVPDDLRTSTSIPIPKSRNANLTDSNNRGITLSSIFRKLCDLIELARYNDQLDRYVRYSIWFQGKFLQNIKLNSLPYSILSKALVASSI